MNQYQKLFNMKTRELTALGKEYGVMSYPVIQRRAAAINAQLGTKYSAKQILAQEINARRSGYGTTKAYTDIMSIQQGKRADVRGSGLSMEGARLFLQQEFSAFAKKQPQVYALTHGNVGDYIAPNGDVYTPAPGLGQNAYICARTGATSKDGPPAGAQPWSPSLAIQAIHRIDEQIQTDAANRPTYDYEDVEFTAFE